MPLTLLLLPLLLMQAAPAAAATFAACLASGSITTAILVCTCCCCCRCWPLLVEVAQCCLLLRTEVRDGSIYEPGGMDVCVGGVVGSVVVGGGASRANEKMHSPNDLLGLMRQRPCVCERGGSVHGSFWPRLAPDACPVM